MVRVVPGKVFWEVFMGGVSSGMNRGCARPGRGPACGGCGGGVGAGTSREAVAGGYGGIFVLLTPTGAMLVARGGSQSGQTAFADAFLIWE